jgi:hypothetical protein
METCSSSTSSDPRDRIYGLLALAHDVPKEGFKIDYSRYILKVKMDFLWFYQCKNKSRPEFISKLCKSVDTMLGDCGSTGEDWPRPERLLETQREKESLEIRRRLLTHKKRRLDMLKEQKMDEIKWREARLDLHSPKRFWDEDYMNSWRHELNHGWVVISQLDSAIASLRTEIELLSNFGYCSGVADKKEALGMK